MKLQIINAHGILQLIVNMMHIFFWKALNVNSKKAIGPILLLHVKKCNQKQMWNAQGASFLVLWCLLKKNMI